MGRLVREGSSGALTVQFGGNYHRLFFVSGAPMWFESSDPSFRLPDTDLGNTEARMNFVKRGVEAPLDWEKGGWTFRLSDGLPANLLLKAVFLDVSPLHSLWVGVRKCLSHYELLGPIADRAAGPVVPQAALPEGWAMLKVGGSLGGLLQDLDRPASVAELLRQHAHEHQDLFKLLWLLEALGWVRRDGNRSKALGLSPPLEDPFGGDAIMAFDEPSSEYPFEPDTREVEVVGVNPQIRPDQILAAVRAGQVPEPTLSPPPSSGTLQALDLPLPETRQTAELRQSEWASGSPTVPRSQTAPSATPGVVMPDLPNHRPSARTPDHSESYSGSYSKSYSGSYSKSNTSSKRPGSETKRVEPTRAPGPRRTSPGLSRSRATSPGSPPALMSAAAVTRDYRNRMGVDYYRFLGVPAKANPSVIDRSWKRLLARWAAASTSRHLPEDVRRMARELAQVAHLAGRTFSVPARRQEYDRRMSLGQAPLAGGMRAARKRDLPKTNPEASPPKPSADHTVQEARALIASREFTRAVNILKHLRLDNPSDPDVLSELGWAVWKESAETEREEAEEYLQLASTFNPRHVRARELLARIAIDCGDNQAAQQRLEQLLKLEPQTQWARSAIAKLPTPDEDRSGAARLAFWKK